MGRSGVPCLAYSALQRLPAVRWATKIELYQALVEGREHLSEHYGDAVSLSSAAQAACMSPYHFMRLFRILFGQTPHEYLTGVRLRHARTLLLESALPTGEIAMCVGLGQASSLSRLFKQKYGVSPSEFRSAHPRAQGHSISQHRASVRV